MVKSVQAKAVNQSPKGARFPAKFQIHVRLNCTVVTAAEAGQGTDKILRVT